MARTEKEIQQLLICCLIASQLAFLNWLTGGVLYGSKVGQYPIQLQQHSDPKFQVHYKKILSNQVYLWLDYSVDYKKFVTPKKTCVPNFYKI